MIDKIKIEHFKSIVDLEFEPGRFNVIIGANGCGKTIAYKEERKMKLSEIWMNGFIGGLPDNF